MKFNNEEIRPKFPYAFDSEGICNIPELGLHFSFHAIAPEGSSIGAWPYCLTFQYKGLDYFGLGDFGSNEKVYHETSKNALLNEMVNKLWKSSLEAIQVSKLGSRVPEIGCKYKVIFFSEGVFHKGTYFESHRDIEYYLQKMSTYNQEVIAKVFFTRGNSDMDYLGHYTKKFEGRSELS